VIRVVVADDQPVVRAGLRMILEAQEDFRLVAEAGTGREAVESCALQRPDVVLMDIQMPGMDGIEATQRVLSREGEVPRVLVLTTFDTDDLVFGALRAGASGFMLKTRPPEDLVAAIRTVAAGEALLAPEVTRRLIEAAVAGPPPIGDGVPPRLAELTGRELEVFGLVARGRTNAEIAAELFVSDGTIKTHVNRILRKLDLRDRVQMVICAYECGVVRPGAA
jgi:DNA-binding NarL/FixJ family response regulator